MLTTALILGAAVSKANSNVNKAYFEVMPLNHMKAYVVASVSVFNEF